MRRRGRRRSSRGASRGVGAAGASLVRRGQALEVPVVVLRRAAALALQPLLQVHLCVSFLLVRTCKFAPAHVTRERFLSSVRSHMRRQVIRSAEGSHANSALERFLAGMNANVPRQFVRPGESSVATLYGTRVWSLVNWGFAGPIGVLPWLDWDEAKRLRALLVNLRKDLMALARGRVVLGKLNRPVAHGTGIGLTLWQARGPGCGLRRGDVLLGVPRVLWLRLRRWRPVLAMLRCGALLRRRAVYWLALGRQ